MLGEMVKEERRGIGWSINLYFVAEPDRLFWCFSPSVATSNGKESIKTSKTLPCFVLWWAVS